MVCFFELSTLQTLTVPLSGESVPVLSITAGFSGMASFLFFPGSLNSMRQVRVIRYTAFLLTGFISSTAHSGFPERETWSLGLFIKADSFPLAGTLLIKGQRMAFML
ncbi:MAG TPA: hypothetical protein PK369_03980 [Thermoclostridium sp.]|nr:hypothetical protein [Thermoclostridium sp.]HPU45326.1 hypothetical protein [Thermoclostridium sp.]